MNDFHKFTCIDVTVCLFYQASKAVEDFGAAVEQLLVKHGKNVIGWFFRSFDFLDENPSCFLLFKLGNVISTSKFMGQ